MTVAFEPAGFRFGGINGGPIFRFTPAVSCLVTLGPAAALDRCWEAQSAVPEAERCGSRKDRFGIPWSIVPAVPPAMTSDPDPERVARVTQAHPRMRRFEIAAPERACPG